MTTLICSTCGCSLVRLGISREEAAIHVHDGNEYYFCCQGCVDVFLTDPQKYLDETTDLIVCPSCLAEKPPSSAVRLEIAGQVVSFCRCPYCPEVFQINPEFYRSRLEGTIPNGGILNHAGCCLKPN